MHIAVNGFSYYEEQQLKDFFSIRIVPLNLIVYELVNVQPQERM